MKQSIRTAALAAAFAFALSASFAADAAVADFHTSKGIACASCHLENPPKADNATIDACIKCHTEKPKGKQMTYNAKTFDNVHTQHFDTYECFECHKGHKPSVSACAECHKAPMQVP